MLCHHLSSAHHPDLESEACEENRITDGMDEGRSDYLAHFVVDFRSSADALYEIKALRTELLVHILGPGRGNRRSIEVKSIRP